MPPPARPALYTAASIAVLVVLASACGVSQKSSSDDGTFSTSSSPGGAGGQRAAVHASSSATTAGGSALGVDVPVGGPDIVETGSVTVRLSAAAGVAGDASRVIGLAQREGGYVEASTITSGRAAAASLTVRVPDDRLDATIAAVATLGTVAARSLGGQDVAGQVVDLAAEETNLQSEEAAVRSILDRARKVSDVLTIQQELFSLQGEIEELQAQRNSLANQVAYASLAVSLAAAPFAPLPHKPGTFARFWHLATHNTVAVLRAVVLAAGWLTPALLVVAAAGLGWLGLRRWRRRLRPRPASEPDRA